MDVDAHTTCERYSDTWYIQYNTRWQWKDVRARADLQRAHAKHHR